MAHDVFLSYSSKDKTIAEGVCSSLELKGIRCWIAPRNITPGISFAEAIIDAICCSKVFVLIFSSNSNMSQQVSKEVERAVHHGIPIIPLRIEDTPMSKQLEYYTSNIHWLDAFTQPFESHINKLCEVIQKVLSLNSSKEENIKEEVVKEEDSNDLEKAQNSYTYSFTAKEPAPTQFPKQEPEQIILESENQKKVVSDHPMEVIERIVPKRKPKYGKNIAIIIAFFCLSLVSIALWFLFDNTKPTTPPVDYYQKGYEFMERRDYEKAKENFNLALVSNPSDYNAQIGLATIHFKQGENEEALIAFQRAIDLNSNESFPYFIIGEIYRKKDAFDNAIKYYQAYLELIPAGSSDYYEVKQIMESLEAPHDAPVFIQPKNNDKPKETPKYDPSAKLQEGIDAYTLGNYVLCKSQMEVVLKNDPKNILAEQYIKESNKKIDDFVQSNFRLAKEAYDKDNYRECIDFLERVLGIDPVNEQSKKLMNLARTNLSSQQIGMLVHQYVRSVEGNKLLNFYEKNCLPKEYAETKKDVQLILRVYKSLRVEVTELSIRYVGVNRAEVTFSCLMTGVQNTDNKWQELSKGLQKWTMVLEKDEWKIENINFN